MYQPDQWYPHRRNSIDTIPHDDSLPLHFPSIHNITPVSPFVQWAHRSSIQFTKHTIIEVPGTPYTIDNITVHFNNIFGHLIFVRYNNITMSTTVNKPNIIIYSSRPPKILFIIRTTFCTKDPSGGKSLSQGAHS